MATRSASSKQNPSQHVDAVRERILDAAYAAFLKQGYAATSTLAIATYARVSKRELYALVGTKKEILVACVTGRARRLELPPDLPEPRDRDAFETLLTTFGTQLLREVTDPVVIGVFRLAIAEAVHAPEVAQVLDSIGRETSRAAVRKIMTKGCAAGLVDASPALLADQFAALLFGDLMVGLLLGTAMRPKQSELASRASLAAAAILQLHPGKSG